MIPIARFCGDFPDKFGIPRQSGLAEALRGIVVFEPAYRNPDSLRGLDGFSHIWLLWEFSGNRSGAWCPTVRPPRLGGNRRMGVFATRSPYRPNPIGLSCVRLTDIVHDPKMGAVLLVSGADLMDGTPIYDIKPYLPYADCRPNATGGFASQPAEPVLTVESPPELLMPLSEERRTALLQILSLDPRPSYQDDPNRVYGLSFAGYNIRFRVAGNILHILEAVPLQDHSVGESAKLQE